MFLLRELVTSDVQFVKESAGDTQNMFIEGIFMQSDMVNRNKRIYPSETLFKEVTRYVNEKVNKNINFEKKLKFAKF